ncbi:MAG: hypothetical protein II567_13190 [Candidatus Riflebacteria bacterium]|nr:hypothetical protein [Candidatus Riflebacteria bacterium]
MADSVNNLGQKFELHGYTVFFNIKDSLAAESILDSLDRATPIFKQVFNLNSDPKGTFYLLNDASEIESIMGTPAKPNESVRLDLLTDTICILLNKIDSANCGETAVKELGHLMFNKAVNEREIRMRQWRTPSWLREGIVLQAAYKIRQDQIQWLQSGWEKLQTAQKNGQLLKPTMMLKEISLMSDSVKKELAFFQSFYMVRLLLTIYCDSFFSKYSTLMKALEDMESETCFRQITSFSFDKFYSMFENWVQKTNAWTAME